MAELVVALRVREWIPPTGKAAGSLKFHSCRFEPCPVQIKKRFMKQFFTGLFIGIIIASLASVSIYKYRSKDKTIAPEKITVHSISGEPSKVEKATAGKDSVSITENHTGAGSSEIVVPYSEIPAANNWITKRKNASIFISPRGNLYGVVSYRFESFTFSAGMCFPFSNFTAFSRYDIFIGAGVWF